MANNNDKPDFADFINNNADLIGKIVIVAFIIVLAINIISSII